MTLRSRCFIATAAIATVTSIALAQTRSPRWKERVLTQFGNRWGWSDDSEAFVPQLVMYAVPPYFHANPEKIDADIETFLLDHGFNGFHVFLSCRWFDMDEEDCRKVRGSNPSLDPRTFDAVELLIRKTHEAGGMVHLWAFGDEQRGQTLSVRKDWGGLDGPVANKIEREIARRWGSLPGWSMGYGFDLDEWVSATEIRQWRNRLQSVLPKFHFLGGRPAGPNRGMNHARYRGWNSGLDYTSYEHHEPTYAVYVDALDESPDKPVLSEDRFRVLALPDRKHYDLSQIRRGLWHSTMAGGVGNIWGYLLDGGSHDHGSAPFPNRDEIRTHFEFLRGRFSRELARCNDADTDPKRETLCLGSAAHDRFLFYKEEAAVIELDLTSSTSSLPMIAVDTKSSYVEIPQGSISRGRHVFEPPYVSDWALAVGEFDRLERDIAPTFSGSVLAPPSTPMLDGWEAGRLSLHWSHDGASVRGFELEQADNRNGVPGPFQAVASFSRTGRRALDLGVPGGTMRWYRVRALGESEETRVSDPVFVATGREGSDLAISGLRPSNLSAAPLERGARYYIDRAYRLGPIPSALRGAMWIATANDDKFAQQESFLRFRTTRSARVFVGFDVRAAHRPHWLRGWEPAGQTMQLEGDGTFDLYFRDFSPGMIRLGGNSAAGSGWQGTGRSNYLVAIVPG